MCLTVCLLKCTLKCLEFPSVGVEKLRKKKARKQKATGRFQRWSSRPGVVPLRIFLLSFHNSSVTQVSLCYNVWVSPGEQTLPVQSMTREQFSDVTLNENFSVTTPNTQISVFCVFSAATEGALMAPSYVSSSPPSLNLGSNLICWLQYQKSPLF